MNGDGLTAARGYASRSEEASVRLLSVAGVLQVRLGRVLKHYGLSPATYDILSVLASEGGKLPAKRVQSLIATASPDLTRLLQRLSDQGLIERDRDPADKRAVVVSLTEQGKSLLQQVAGPIESLHKQMLGRIKKGERKELVRILKALEEANEGRV